MEARSPRQRRQPWSRSPGRLRVWGPVILGIAALTLGCAGLGYTGQAVWGGLKMLSGRRPVDELLRDEATPDRLRQQLARAQAVREFASENLGLPDNGSYRRYKELGRPFAVWNVVAAPELSIEPIVWCFPVAGCVTYRGYFSERRAERFADKLRARGYDVDVAGVAAFSTLGWLKDPLLSTFIHYPEAQLAGLMLHELAHQRLYLKGDTPFNESFATVVELAGVERWLSARGDGEAIADYRQAKRRQMAVAEMMAESRERLAAVYAAPETDDWKRRRKQEILRELRRESADLWSAWGSPAGYDRWFGEGLNNARLAAVGAYFEWVPALQALLERQGGNLQSFYGEAERLAALAPGERQIALSGLAPSSGSAGAVLPLGEDREPHEFRRFHS